MPVTHGHGLSSRVLRAHALTWDQEAQRPEPGSPRESGEIRAQRLCSTRRCGHRETRPACPHLKQTSPGSEIRRSAEAPCQHNFPRDAQSLRASRDYFETLRIDARCTKWSQPSTLFESSVRGNCGLSLAGTGTHTRAMRAMRATISLAFSKSGASLRANCQLCALSCPSPVHVPSRPNLPLAPASSTASTGRQASLRLFRSSLGRQHALGWSALGWSTRLGPRLQAAHAQNVEEVLHCKGLQAPVSLENRTRNAISSISSPRARASSGSRSRASSMVWGDRFPGAPELQTAPSETSP